MSPNSPLESSFKSALSTKTIRWLLDRSFSKNNLNTSIEALVRRLTRVNDNTTKSLLSSSATERVIKLLPMKLITPLNSNTLTRDPKSSKVSLSDLHRVRDDLISLRSYVMGIF